MQTTYAEHRAQVDAITADMIAAARELPLTDDEKELVRLIAQHSPDAQRAMTSLLRRANA